jgi:chaperonin GroES
MNLKPLGERVILKAVVKEEKTASGIILPKSEDRKEGVVVDVGTLKDGRPIPLLAGDKVIYGGYSSEEIDINGEKHLILDYKDVLAKVEE